MFAEEEWAEVAAVPADEHYVCNAKATGKSKTISKYRLKQTLQTLGSVPVWDDVKGFDDSDEAMEEAPVHINKATKRCKKRKKTFAGGSEGKEIPGAVDVAETPVKRRKPRQKPTDPSFNTSLESAKDKDMSCTEDDAERKLSRQQWKNKMKNKKRCKNKFRHNSTEAVEINGKETDLAQTQAISTAQRSRGHDLSPVRVRSGEKGGTGKPRTRTSKKDQVITDKGNNSTKYLKPTVEKPVSKEAKTQRNAAHTSLCEEQKPVTGKSPQLKAKKLRQILNAHVINGSKKLAEEKGEPLKTDNEEGRSPGDRSSDLRYRMEKRLESARFRYINELLYTSTSGEAKRMFQQDPNAITIYHKGYMEQVKHWPANPVDMIISYIRQKPQSLVVADFGCGDCKIARSVKNKVHCFDLAPVCALVTACDMARVPLDDCTVDIAVFCLSLMGTNLSDFLAEANRVLQMGGVLKIAEVASRFDDIRQFIGALSHLGFKLVSKDTDNSHFYSFEFVKIQNALSSVKKAGLKLRPCLYKKR